MIINQPDSTKKNDLVTQRPTTDDRAAWHPYWQTQNQKWRTEPEIDKKRQQELLLKLFLTSSNEPNIYPFLYQKLTRADVEWLIANHAVGKRKNLGQLGRKLLEKRCSEEGRLQEISTFYRETYQLVVDVQSLDLRGADLQGVDLSNLPLSSARLEETMLANATLTGAFLVFANLERADLSGAKLDQADLSHANLTDSILEYARLEQANLSDTRLEGANLRDGHLEGACLIGAFFSGTTNLEQVFLSSKKDGSVFLNNVHWNDVDLSGIDWSQLKVLGDEKIGEERNKHHLDIAKQYRKKEQIKYLKSANKVYMRSIQQTGRTYHRIAITLQEQGLDGASYFAYRAMIFQRKVLWRQRKIGQYLFSLALDLFSGYGYKLLRSFLTYCCLIGLFTILYRMLGSHLAWNEAFVVSMTAFHGRGFFPGTFSPGDPLAFASAIEAFVGLIVEVTFIATLTQRLFGK